MNGRDLACRAALLSVLLASTAALAGASPRARTDTAIRVAQNEQPAPVSAEPQRTAATFADWVVRCDRATGTPPRKACESVQTFTLKGKEAPFAQLAFAHVLTRPDVPGSLTMVLILPVNLALDKQPVFTTGSGDHPFQLQRCLPDGCAAVMNATDLVKEIRGTTKGGVVTFVDAAQQKVNLPVSTRGFPQALDDLAKEMATP